MAGAILYDNKLRNATIVNENTLAGFPAANLLDGRTATQAGFVAGGGYKNLDFSFSSPVNVTALGIARHNLASSGASIQVQGSSDNFATVDNVFFTSFSGLSDSAYINTSFNATYQYYRIRIYLNTSNTYIGDLFLGNALTLERSQRHGFIKPEFADGDKIIANVTRGQNLAGLTVEPGVKSVKYDLFYYSESFFIQWAALRETMKKYPVYIQWDTNKAPFYCWPNKKIPEPAYSKNINGYYSVTLDMNGITE